ncbi:MAG TPA: hypothetical protein DCS62_07575, partial [Escherichia coli]|nr:hypothetical protein [Escherichia coli]
QQQDLVNDALNVE